MEGEINIFILVWLTIFISLTYCHFISNFIPKGTIRLISFLPVIILFLVLPLNLTTIHLCGLTSFFITWLANFKLILFAFGQGPLFSQTPIPLSKFIPIACLPIKIQNEKQPCSDTTKKNHVSTLNYATKIMLVGVFLKVYDYKEYLHPKVRLLLYGFHMYIMLEMFLAMFALLARVLVKAELEPQFDEPYMLTSLQDFWGKRWNLMVSSILKPSVYEPVRYVAGRFVSRKWASIPAAFATFVVSGVMHELIFYYIGRGEVTWEVTCYFLLQGVCLGVEMGIKKVVNRRFELPVAVARVLAMVFVFATSFWLFFPPLLRCKPDVMACTESVAFIEFVAHGRLISPKNITCPFLLKKWVFEGGLISPNMHLNFLSELLIIE